MFTGIVTDIGTVRSAEQRGDLRLTIAQRLRPRDGRPRRVDRLLGRLPDRGRQGPRLVRGRRQARNRVAHRRRTCGAKARASTSNARCGWATNLAATSSPAMSTGRQVVGVCPDGGSTRIGIRVPAALGAVIAAKGSITLDGVSLTVNEVARRRRRHDPFRGQHHPPHRAAHHAWRRRGGATAQCRDRRSRALSQAHASRTITASESIVACTSHCNVILRP